MIEEKIPRQLECTSDSPMQVAKGVNRIKSSTHIHFLWLDPKTLSSVILSLTSCRLVNQAEDDEKQLLMYMWTKVRGNSDVRQMTHNTEEFQRVMSIARTMDSIEIGGLFRTEKLMDEAQSIFLKIIY